MIGGSGRKFTLGVVARHADWWNAHYKSIDQLRDEVDALRGHCEAEGRDFDSIRKVYNTRIFMDRSHKAALKTAEEWREKVPESIAGDPSSVRDELTRFAEELGMNVLIAAFPRFQDTDDMKMFIDEVIPTFA